MGEKLHFTDLENELMLRCVHPCIETKLITCHKIMTFALNGFIKNIDFYPLLINDELTAFALRYDDSPDSNYQVTTALVSEVKSIISKKTNFAFIYDKNKCYLYDGTDFHILATSQDDIKDRAILDESNINTEELSTICLGNLSDPSSFGYTSIQQTRSQTYISYGVSHVSQSPYDNLCWAASVACISNYLRGINSITPYNIAQNYWGTNIDRPITTEMAAPVLRTYSYYYCTYRSEVPADNVIYSNISQDLPIYASFYNEPLDNYHATVLYGINVFSRYISIMDPLGYVNSASYSSTYKCYQYYLPTNSARYYFNSAICRYWTY